MTQWKKTTKCPYCDSTKPLYTKAHHRKHMRSKTPLPCMEGCLSCQRNDNRIEDSD